MEMLEHQESDFLDKINDRLVELCDTDFAHVTDLVSYVERADHYLRLEGYRLDPEDVERLSSAQETAEGELSEDIFPIYSNDGEQTEFDLTVSYTFDEDLARYLIDMEVDYSWEAGDPEDDEE